MMSCGKVCEIEGDMKQNESECASGMSSSRSTSRMYVGRMFGRSTVCMIIGTVRRHHQEADHGYFRAKTYDQSL